VNIRSLILLLAVFAYPLHTNGQQSPALSSQPAPPPVEPVDSSFVPIVESRSQGLEVVSVRRRDPFIRLRLRNNSDKNIYAIRMRYHKGGAAILLSFVMSDHPSEVLCLG
jgi:hypothetical protein